MTDESTAETERSAYMEDERMVKDAPGDVPDELVEELVSSEVRYGECSNCGVGHYYIRMVHDDYPYECSGCGTVILL